ncbi:MAG: hypothetical protein LBE13_09505 [Bacteroidales bacterium]|jgi:hypothetical protein|nr:hypothetical protein [Bacteroidales bacterium]
MKKFLFSILIFFTLDLVILILALSSVYFITSSSSSFKIPEEKNIIVVGDSHTGCAIDDSIFSYAINISQGGAAYLYSYVKLRKFLNENSHIDTVIISFHAGSVQRSTDELFFGDRYILSHVPNYFSLLQAEELLLLMNKPSFYSAVIKMPVRHIRAILKLVIDRTLTYEDLHIGKYANLDRDQLQKAIELAGNKESVKNEYSEYQLEYLFKIIKLCNNKDVELILFNSPTYNSEKYGDLPLLVSCYNTYFSNITYLDFSSFALPDYGYGDIGHLNFKGAEIFSQYLENNYESLFGK